LSSKLPKRSAELDDKWSVSLIITEFVSPIRVQLANADADVIVYSLIEDTHSHNTKKILNYYINSHELEAYKWSPVVPERDFFSYLPSGLVPASHCQ
jgi:hypothetical protein